MPSRVSALILVALALFTGCLHRRPAAVHRSVPIGIYSPGSTSNLPILRQAGFSHVRGSANREFLDAAQSAGLGVLANPGTSAGVGFNPAAVRTSVRLWDRHPALWAWYLSDEPDLNEVSPAEVSLVRRTLLAAGSRRPSALVVYRGPSLATHHDADILMVDRYPVGWQPLAAFFQHMRHGAVAAGVGHRSFIAVIQSFDWSVYSDIHPFPEPITPRPPTTRELRCMAWGARVIGADGLFFYCFDDGRWRIREHPETWEGLCQVVREIRDREPLFTAPRWGLPPRSENLEPSRRFNEAIEPSVIWSAVRVSPGAPGIPPGTYWIQVNTTAEFHQLRIRDAGWAGVALHDLDRDTLRQIDADGWMEPLSPYEVRLMGPIPDRP